MLRVNPGKFVIETRSETVSGSVAVPRAGQFATAKIVAVINSWARFMQFIKNQILLGLRMLWLCETATLSGLLVRHWVNQKTSFRANCIERGPPVW